MTILEKYKKIYDQEISNAFSEQIMIYDIIDDEFLYYPLSHNCKEVCDSNCTNDCYKSLGELMRKSLVFYAYGEEEVVQNMEDGIFADFEQDIQYVYNNRLPKRQPNMDGLPGEVLFDLIIQNMVPDAYKMAVRTIFRQDDNNEIKGYDLTYITNKDDKITFWLGQAKLGKKDYCKKGIYDDLIKKFESIYMSKQVYFLCDKPSGLTDEAKKINLIINRINRLNSKSTKDSVAEISRANAFIQLLSDEKIDINIPCLLVYGKGCIYENLSELNQSIQNEMEEIKKYFQMKTYNFENIVPKILFFIFPIENLDGIRGSEGFYCGL